MYKKLPKIFLIINLLIISFIFIKGFSSNSFNKESVNQELEKRVGQEVSFKAMVVKEREERIDKQRLVVLVLNKKILITTNLYPKYSYGDYIKIEGNLLEPENFSGFDYKSYLLRYGISYVMYYPRISKLDELNLSLANKSYKKLIIFKQKIRNVINIGLPEPHSGLANAMLLGYKKSISDYTQEIFSKTGLSHLIAISGTHISILTAIILSFFLSIGLNRKISYKIILLFLFIYPIFTGLSASTIRASIMGSLSLLALSSNRLKISFNLLVFVAALMIVVNPLILHHDIGFQLSFLAVLGIIYIYPILERFKDRIIRKAEIKTFRKLISSLLSFLNISISAQLFCSPIIALNFKEISLISPISNILVVWIFPLFFIFLLIATLLTFIFPSLIYILYLPSYVCLDYIYKTAETLAGLNLVLKFENISPLFICIYYLILITIIYLINKNKAKKIKKEKNKKRKK
ncbi:MAG: ComEC/Rec2 family competence protein [Patescibacteria group bacterium]|jgi:competence protein ComEC|nr:ComEC/Rec2 family competence protein [Patescibacteria group bacterium]